MRRPTDINERVAVLETEMDDIKSAHMDIKISQAKLGDKLDEISKHLLMVACVLGGLIVGSKLLSPEALEHLKSLFGI